MNETARLFVKPIDDSAEKGNGPGRPAEDRFSRRMEIYLRVAPLIMEKGVHGLTMEEAAAAACLSVGGLYHYFSSKRELVLLPLLPGVCKEGHRRLEAGLRAMREENPDRIVEAIIDTQIEGVMLTRPAVHAALELGGGDLWRLAEEEHEHLLQYAADAIHQLTGTRHDPGHLARTLRRMFMAALLDRTMTQQEMRTELKAVFLGEPLGALVEAGT